jgi:SM-20-related protein
MPFPDFFEQFDIISVHEFLSAEICARLCSEIENATEAAGMIWNPKEGSYVKEEIKKRKEFIGVPAESEILIREKLLQFMLPAAEHFDIDLKGVQPIKFTCYDTGDYYRKHIDVSPHADAPAIINERKISVIIFLNQEGEDLSEGDYCGGNLTFYGLFDDPSWQNVGLPLESESGLLLAFRPDTLHEVTPVTQGRRYTITTWFT